MSSSPIARAQSFARPLACAAVSLCLVPCIAAGQTSEELLAQPENEFRQIVKAYREHAIRDTVTYTDKRGVGDELTKSVDEFEFIFTNDDRCFIDLDEIQVYAPGNGSLYVLHDRNPLQCFRLEYEGPLTNDVFLEAMSLTPFPQIPLRLAEDPLWEFFMMAPLDIVGSGRRTIEEDRELTEIRLDGPEHKISLCADPNTRLPAFIEVRFVRGMGTAATRTIEMRSRIERLAEIDDAWFTPDLMDREMVDDLALLEPLDDIIDEGESDGVEGALEGEQGDPRVGMRIPALTFDQLGGGRVDLRDAEQALVLDLWATWCGPCIMYLPHLERAAVEAADAELPVRFYAVNVWERAESDAERVERVAAFWAEKEFSLPVLMDHESKLADELQIRGIPTTIIVRPDGIIHAVHVGADLRDPAALVRRLLDEIRDAISASEPPAREMQEDV
jgi:thiol-disulfide isomerase/thioredoxin